MSRASLPTERWLASKKKTQSAADLLRRIQEDYDMQKRQVLNECATQEALRKEQVGRVGAWEDLHQQSRQWKKGRRILEEFSAREKARSCRKNPWQRSPKPLRRSSGWNKRQKRELRMRRGRGKAAGPGHLREPEATNYWPGQEGKAPTEARPS